ncbi:AAA family ATPase [Rhizobium laguerreae]|uniref:ATP-binding protein n=1 Tax=Rhizobium laguerreae TaxID=1076926 RepID=UPI001C9133A0|nr:ATP-binding protein [Rhizobium laguerreae]MBY3104515.1 AAA family ATPase [Rhizobium laguerreae]
MIASLQIERMLVTRGANVLYDEPFHPGVNIIHGSNGSGKSSVADFIFFGLGGDLREWKESASRANNVYLQVLTPSGMLTLRREISTDPFRPMSIFFGQMNDALRSTPESWQHLPYRRPEHGYSFSQVLFKAIGLPESISDGASNITMHQILRLLYVDQLTPVQRIFRVENFDTWQTRQVIGDLLLGIGGYDLFDKQIALRATEQKYKEAVTSYRNLVAIASGYGENILVEHINSAMAQMNEERTTLLLSIEALIAAKDDPSDQEKVKAIRSRNAREYGQARRTVSTLESDIETLEYEIADSEEFIKHLKQSIADFDDATITFAALGHLSFEFCPSCFAPVHPKTIGHCELCDTKRTDGDEDSRTLAVRLDLEMQLKESEALQAEREIDLNAKRAALRIGRQALRRAMSAIELDQTGAVTGRETAIAELSRKIGFIDSQLEGLQKRLELSKRIAKASDDKEDLNTRITKLKGDIEAIQRAQNKRKLLANTLVSNQTKLLLDRDMEEHSDFGEVQHVSFSFADDWIAINGEKNRGGSASGMVILKNSFALALLASSLLDKSFKLPRWMLFDNVEDKGMVEERSWNFQRLIVDLSSKADVPHQIIFTTSKIAPELDGTPMIVGKRYTRAARSLN